MISICRFRGLAAGFLLSLTILLATPLPRSQAQDKAEQHSAEVTEEATEGAPSADEEATAPPAPQSQLYWIIHTSGWIGGVLLVISIYFVAVVVQLFLELRDDVIMPPQLLEGCQKLLNAKDYQSVYKAALDDSSELGQLLASGMAAISSGLSESREAIDRTGEALTVEMEKKISMLAVIGSLGPMIGLLGTLKGMIASFSVIAMSDTQLKASEVAGGISEALLITFEGVALSVPAIYLFAVFKNRISTQSVKMVNVAHEFMRRVYQLAHSRQGSASAT